ncbi:MAG: DUF2141 domain-containing protein [Bacteroidia bacterium]|nr:DUF2141 domain-containing protein [Bacteroidia bacterium]
MKKSILTMLAVVFLVLLYSFVAPHSETFSLTVEVKELRNSKGVVQYALYNKDKTIPDEHYKNYYKMLTAQIICGTSTVTFLNLPAGKYAVNILHDENKNGKIDKGFILPIEGIGFSNFKSVGFTNLPSFLKACFDVKCDSKINVKVIYL